MHIRIIIALLSIVASACIGGGGGSGSSDGGTGAASGGDGDGDGVGDGQCESGDKLWCDCGGADQLATCVDGRFVCDCSGGDGDGDGAGGASGDGDAVVCAGDPPFEACPNCMLGCGPSGWTCDCGAGGNGAGGNLGTGGFQGAGGFQGTGGLGGNMCPIGYPCTMTPVGTACNNGNPLLPLCDAAGGCSYLPGALPLMSDADCYCFLQC